jgi:hypothetical protein
MSQELTTAASITFNGKAGLKEFKTPSFQVILDMAGTLFESGAQTITAAGEVAIDIGGIPAGTAGMMLLYNSDAENFITYGGTGNLINKLRPGAIALVELDGIDPFAQADTADVTIQRWIFAA